MKHVSYVHTYALLPLQIRLLFTTSHTINIKHSLLRPHVIIVIILCTAATLIETGIRLRKYGNTADVGHMVTLTYHTEKWTE